ncbi:3-beta hydroxysteroid dehydrogenase [Candidatus Campbellbacteria bacterium CG22_combo_CG10-13_8_21_14_all_36_13]|uniref:3-beta hydroxysteroid dehydrogenase n=1 Tax=Candidatus Campbellbacteria bacterium CG22_combo_CG10-13_8_21_14_all_36_13 TaxID=1974529 RepID=A0A2H0DY09_9BACT|nr:MAG: 3-beta hydroxysteroid dehydrogenase [Candidatus Campbellbacteria bacterium CG22_combo_CG10-13_8_21_14_all_36_13]
MNEVNKKKILVTGSAGFIGSHISERLAKDGHEVIGIDNFSDYYSRDLKEKNVYDIKRVGVKFFEIDLVTDDLSEVVNGVTHVVHCAAQPGLSDLVHKDIFFRNNVVATEKLLEALKDSKTLQCFIYTSTSSVYGINAHGDEETEPNPISDYGHTKLETENLIRKYQKTHNFPASILRPYSVIGPRERPEKLFTKLIKSVLEEEEFPLFKGSDEHIRSYTYVGDIVDGIVLALFNPDKSVGEIFNIGGGEVTTTGQAIQIVSEIIGKPARIKHLQPRQGDQEYTRANFDKAERVLGYKPKTSFKEAIKRQVEWYIDEIHNGGDR